MEFTIRRSDRGTWFVELANVTVWELTAPHLTEAEVWEFFARDLANTIELRHSAGE